MKKIGILSDTHGRLREEVVEILRGCDVILHAGDINTPQALARLRELAPLYAVRGNADREWADALPQTLSEEICGLRIFMVHNKKEIPADVTGYDLVVYGHSHKFEERREGNCLFLNPGSCGPRRFSQPVTMAVAEVTAEMGDIRVIRKDIVQEEGGAAFHGEPAPDFAGCGQGKKRFRHCRKIRAGKGKGGADLSPVFDPSGNRRCRCKRKNGHA